MGDIAWAAGVLLLWLGALFGQAVRPTPPTVAPIVAAPAPPAPLEHQCLSTDEPLRVVACAAPESDGR